MRTPARREADPGEPAEQERVATCISKAHRRRIPRITFDLVPSPAQVGYAHVCKPSDDLTVHVWPEMSSPPYDLDQALVDG